MIVLSANTHACIPSFLASLLPLTVRSLAGNGRHVGPVELFDDVDERDGLERVGRHGPRKHLEARLVTQRLRRGGRGYLQDGCRGSECRRNFAVGTLRE